MNHILMAPVLIPMITALVLMMLNPRHLALTRVISVCSAVLGTLAAAYLMWLAMDGDIRIYALGNWAPPFGIVLMLDRLSALMLVLVGVLSCFCLFYAARGHDAPGNKLHALSHFMLLGVNGAFLTGDLFNLFVFFEILLISSYAMLLHGPGAKRARAGIHYVVINLVGSAIFLMAISALYGVTGALNMVDLSIKIAALPPEDAPLAATAASLLLVVFGLKAAMVPLYLWLPRAYATASAPVAALFAIMSKVGIYAIIRVYTLIFGASAGVLADFVWPWLWPIGLVTLVVGVFGTLAARGLRIQVAYLVVVSVGTLLASLAINTERAFASALYYLVHSTWICAGLFLLVDLITRQRGHAGDRILPGQAVPQAALLGVLFFVAAISVVGLPPLSGFIGKLLILSSATGEPGAAWLWTIVLLGSLVTITAMSRSGSTIFWSAKGKANTLPADTGAMAATIGLISLSVLLMLFGGPVFDYTSAVAKQLFATDLYISAMRDFTTR